MKLTKQLGTSPLVASVLPLSAMAMVSFGLLILLAMCDVQANGLKDPTQPPVLLAANNTSIDNQNANSGPVLQSVMISTQFRAAIINGQKVMLGKKYEQATLISVDENQVVLRNPDMTTQVLKMDYADMKKNVSPAITDKVKVKKLRKLNV